jgi:hypothetical protein
LKGFGGAGVLEVVEDIEGNAYRAVYTLKLADMDNGKARLTLAVEIHARYEDKARKKEV